jgi:hypothetical protein
MSFPPPDFDAATLPAYSQPLAPRSPFTAGTWLIHADGWLDEFRVTSFVRVHLFTQVETAAVITRFSLTSHVDWPSVRFRVA